MAGNGPGTPSSTPEEAYLPPGRMRPASPSLAQLYKEASRATTPQEVPALCSPMMRLRLFGLLFLLVISLPSGKMVGTGLITKVEFFQRLRHLKTPRGPQYQRKSWARDGVSVGGLQPPALLICCYVLRVCQSLRERSQFHHTHVTVRPSKFLFPLIFL